MKYLYNICRQPKDFVYQHLVIIIYYKRGVSGSSELRDDVERHGNSFSPPAADG